MPLEIAVIVGSLRQDSFNRRLAQALARLPEGEGHAFRFLRIDDLPLYDQDRDADQPASAQRLKAEVRSADGVLFVTPEYNRSIPGVLKNAIDHASRPYGDSAWRGKPAGIAGVSIGASGTLAAQQHLRNVCSVLDMHVMGQPELFLQTRDGMFAADGGLTGTSAEFVGNWLASFLNWVARRPG